MNKTLLSAALLVLLSGCVSTRPATLAPPSFMATDITGVTVENAERVVVDNGVYFWRLHFSGKCQQVLKADYLLFLDEMQLAKWPTQPWREGYGPAPGWPENGKFVNRNSHLMRVSSNGMTWVHPISPSGSALYGEFVPYECKVDRVEPLWR